MKTKNITASELVTLALVAIGDVADAGKDQELTALAHSGFIATRGEHWRLTRPGRAMLRALPRDFWFKGARAARMAGAK